MRWAPVLLAVAVAGVSACGSGKSDLAIRAYSEHYAFRISSDPVPPMAREKARYKIVVNDKESGQPISGGEGLIYAQTRDGVRTWDSFTAAPELGTYVANLSFLVAADWAMGLRFRRDSTSKLEQVDWMQQVVADTAKNP